MKFLSRSPERGALLKPHGKATGSTGEALRWTCDADSASIAPGREYRARTPWDTVALLAILASFMFLLEWSWNVEMYKQQDPTRSWLLMAGYLAATLAVLTLLLNPTRVRRDADNFVMQYPMHQFTVPVGDVLELVMVSSLDDFVDVLVRWAVFPFGCRLSVFIGVPTGLSASCALLTSRCFWSFYFCLEDPIQFLVDNQRPLDLGQRYRTLGRAIVREGESLQTQKICMMRKGAVLRIERQSGRRVFARFEGTEVSGWMSYINQLGHFLLSKDTSDATLAAGTVGASALSKSYGATIELPNMIPEGEEE